MKEPSWIKVNTLIAIHKEIIAEHGGIEGIRDSHLLESSCAAPIQLFYYSNPRASIFELAARYTCSLTRNPPFRDGNKRMAVIVCELFLEINNYELVVSDEESYLVIIDLASKNIIEKDLISWIKQNAKKT